MPKSKILIVEDETIIALHIETMLKMKGYVVLDTLSTGEMAIAQVESQRPDLIIMDILLKGDIDGITTVEEITKKHDIPFIYMTAHSDEKTLERAKTTEPHGYILKPVNQNELYSVIEIALYKYQLERKLKKSEENLARVQRLAQIGSWEFFPETNRVTWSNMLYIILGFKPGEIEPDANIFMEMIHPEDEGFVKREIALSIKENKPFSYDYRLVKKDNSVIYVHTESKEVFDTDENTRKVLGFLQDITARKKTEEALMKRIKGEELILDISTNFINLPVASIDDGINQALKQIAMLSNAARSSLFILSGDQSIITNTHEWCTAPDDSQISQLQEIPVSMFGHYLNILLRFENVIICRSADIPPEAHNEAEWSKQYGFRPLLFVPLILQRKLFGTLGFYGNINEEIEWDEQFILLLKIVAEIFVRTIERKRTEELL